MKAFLSLKADLIDHRWRLLAGLLALLVVDLLQLLIPRVVKHGIDDLTLGRMSSSALLFYALQILILALIIAVFRYGWRYCLLGTSRRIEEKLRNRLFDHLQSLSYAYFRRTKIGDLMAHATNDIDAVRMSLAMGLVFLLDTIILGTLTIFFMIYIDPVLTVYAILPMPLITLITLFFSRKIHRRFEAVQRSFGALTEQVREAISGVRVVRAYVQEEREREKLSHRSADYVRRNVRVTRVWGMFFPLLLLLSNLSMVIVLYVGGRLTILQTITPGDFVAFMSYLGILAWPMMALGWAVNVVQRGAASMERLNRIFSEVPEISDVSVVRPSFPLKGRINVSGLTYTANEGSPLLRDIHLEIAEGEKVVLVGRTGAGKTVLCHLLARILEAPDERILIDGIPLKRIPVETLRRSIGYVPQETFLFSASIRENIAFGRLGAGKEEIKEAARLAQIYDEIMEFPEGMDTRVGERGITLSGGQRQRVAIARAVLMDPPLLILDDALSSVDIQTEQKILEGLQQFLEGRTSLLVTHRIGPLRRADRIIVLERGRVAETGRHATLLAKGGIYADLYWRSQLEEELEGDEGNGAT